MAYKTKKINRRRRIRGYSKRRYYGGADLQPSILSRVVGIGTQLANKALDMGVDGIASVTGTDPNLGTAAALNNLKDKASNIVHVIADTNLGDQLGSELGKATEKILGPIEEKGTDILNKFIKKEEDAVIGLGANLAEDVAYPIVAPIRTLASGVSVLENSAEALAESTGLLKDQIRTFNDIKDKVSNTFSAIGEAAAQGANNVTTGLIDKAEQYASNPDNTSVSGVQTQIATPQAQSSTVKTFTPPPTPIPPVQSGGAKQMRKYRNEAKQIGGRIQKSLNTFLSPVRLTRKQLHNKYNRSKRR
jgi:hypothetical protein